MSPYQDQAVMQRHIAKWQASNSSQAEYCKKHGIKPHIFSYYKSKFSTIAASATSSSQLIPVKLQAEDTLLSVNQPTRCESVRLTHANGFSLEITPNTDLAYLKPLLQLLSSVS